MEIEAHKPAVRTLDEILSLEFEDTPSWIGSDILPKGGKMLLGGHPKVGKTFLLIEIGRAIATGTAVYGHPMFPTETGKVLLIDMEVGERKMQHRLSRVCDSRDVFRAGTNLAFVCKDPFIQLDEPEGLGFLYEAVRAHQPNVLMLDPMQDLHTSDENSASDMTQVFNNVNRIIAEFSHLNLSVIMTHHFQKRPNDVKNYDPLDYRNFRGSGKWAGWPDTIVTTERKDEHIGWQGKGWSIKMRHYLRHGEDFDDINLAVNANDDLRVTWADAMPATTTVRPNLVPIQMHLG